MYVSVRLWYLSTYEYYIKSTQIWSKSDNDPIYQYTNSLIWDCLWLSRMVSYDALRDYPDVVGTGQSALLSPLQYTTCLLLNNRIIGFSTFLLKWDSISYCARKGQDILNWHYISIHLCIIIRSLNEVNQAILASRNRQQEAS